MQETHQAVIEYLNQRPIPVGRIFRLVQSLAEKCQLEDLEAIRTLAILKKGTFDIKIAVPVLVLLPLWGEPGIALVAQQVKEGPFKGHALTVLAAASMGRIVYFHENPFLHGIFDGFYGSSIPDDHSHFAFESLKEIIFFFRSSSWGKSELLSLVASTRPFAKDPDMAIFDYLSGLLLETQLMINFDIIQQFKQLLDDNSHREQDFHLFLEDNPALLDPFAAEVRTKHELGDDFITDFVIRQLNNQYVLVEIEKSSHKLFTKRGTFTAALTNAVGQVRDFQAWIHDHVAYARTKLPDIRHPEGLVVIGRRTDLTNAMKIRLQEENFSRRGHIKILTYDDLIDQASAVYDNLLRKPKLIRSADQRSI